MASVRFKHKHANPLEYCLLYNKHSVNSVFIILVFEKTEMQVLVSRYVQHRGK